VTTTEATPSTDPFAAIQAVEQRLQDARQERGRLGRQQRDWAANIAQVEAHLRQLARSDPSQFTQDGLPKPKSEASRLRAKLEQARPSRWGDVLAGADERIERLELEHRELVRVHAAALARAEWDGGVEACGRVRELARELLAAVAEAQRSYHVLHSILTTVPGTLDGRSIEVDGRLDQLEQLLGSLEGLKPPRLQAFTPFEGEDVTVLALEDGNWIRAASAHQSRVPLADPQPPRVGASAVSERELRAEDLPTLFGHTPEQADVSDTEQPVESEGEGIDADDRQPDQPADPVPDHDALILGMLATSRRDPLLDRILGREGGDAE
jgi:hypothetical protein